MCDHLFKAVCFRLNRLIFLSRNWLLPLLLLQNNKQAPFHLMEKLNPLGRTTAEYLCWSRQRARVIQPVGSSAAFTLFNYWLPQTAAAFLTSPTALDWAFQRADNWVFKLNVPAVFFYSLLLQDATEFKIINKSTNDCGEITVKTTGSISQNTTFEKINT